jgi:hypothetical protein
MKLKHNKKRNTAFLFEALVREITKCAVKEQKELQKKIMKILKEFFNKESILNHELKLYKSILESTNLHKGTAERILTQTTKQYNFLDKQQIFEAQTKLINKVNKTVGPNVYSNFVPNYKYVATAYQIFNGNLEPTTYVMMENEIIDYMSSPKEEQDNKKSDKVIFKEFLNRFNETYNKSLNENQKKLLGHYINSFNDNGLELKLYLNEEVARLNNKLKKISDKDLQPKLKQVLTLIESFKTSKFDEKLLKKILQIQELVEEFKSNEN